MKVRHILVTGAGGFIGKRVVKTLLQDGYEVTAMIRNNSNAFFSQHKRLHILKADITDFGSFSAKVGSVNAFVHLAANKYHPLLSYKTNLDGAKNIVKLIKNKKISGKRLINISTQSTKIRTKGVYGSSKALSDKIIQSANIDWTTLKPSLVYGNDKGTLFNTISSYIKQLPVIPLIGDGKWMLYPIDVDDLARIISKTLETRKTYHKIYDIGCEKGITFNDLIRLMEHELHKNKPIIHVPVTLGIIAVTLALKIFPKLPISVDNVLGSTQSTSCDPKPAIEDLKFTPTPIKAGVKKYLSNQSGKELVKVAIVGLGKMGILHSMILNSIPQVKIVALIDKDTSLINTSRSMGINANPFTSLIDALQKEQIDAVYICTPTFAHKEIIELCLKHNLPFFAEKPVLNIFEDYKFIPDVSREKNSSGYFWIFKREIQFTKKILETKKIGTVRNFSVRLKHSEVFGPKKGWLFNKKLSGGGVIMNPGPHAFSIINYLFGEAEITKSSLKFIYGNSVEDEAKVEMSISNKIKGALNANWSTPGFPVLTIEYKIEGDQGSIDFKNGELSVRTKRKNKVYKYHQIPQLYEVYNLNPKSGGDAYYTEDFFFIQSVLGRVKLINNLDFSYSVESMIHNTYEKS